MSQNTSLIFAQREAFNPILNPETQVPWKILCYDSQSQKRLSTLYRVGDLREMCITLHFNLDSVRERLQGVLAIYLIQPIKESVDKIIEDFQRDLYSKVVINFIYPIDNNLLEYLAKQLGKIGGAVQKIQKILQHNVEYISLNHNLFEVPNIAIGLLSIVLNLKTIPLIIYQKNSKQEQIAREFIELIKTIDFNSDYPQLAIILPDRDEDLNPLIMHSNTYGALLHDIHKIKYNQVSVDSQDYDLSPQYDNLWSQACNMPLPDALDKIDNELSNWNTQYQQITQQNQEIASALNAIDLVPQMNQQKKIIESHLNLAKSLTQQAKLRQLDKFYQIGQSIMQNEQIQINDLLNQQDESLNDLDKLRLLILMLLNNYIDYKKYEQQLQIKNEKYKIILNNFKQKIGYNESKIQNISKQTILKSIVAGTGMIAQKGKGLISNFIQKREKKFAIVQLIENLFNNILKAEDLISLFEIYDGKMKNIIIPDYNILTSVKDILICFIDGGCYNEYAELSEYSKTSNKNIYYGGKQLFNADEFLQSFQ